MIKVTVKSVSVDSESNAPFVLLEVEDSTVQFPIWIGLLEASSIAWQLENIKPERPMTHDLLLATIHAFGGAVKAARIVSIVENTFIAELEIERSDGSVSLDCRPSDAISLALREKAPIYVDETVMSEIQISRPVDPVDADLKDRWKGLLEKLKPEDFGKYKM